MVAYIKVKLQVKHYNIKQNTVWSYKSDKITNYFIELIQ